MADINFSHSPISDTHFFRLLSNDEPATSEQSHLTNIENFCEQPDDILLIRNSFAYLNVHHQILNPRAFHTTRSAVTEKTILIWAKAFSLKINDPVLVPAETIYYPFDPKPHNTKSYFYSGITGLAVGSTYLQAAIQALYGLIKCSNIPSSKKLRHLNFKSRKKEYQFVLSLLKDFGFENIILANLTRSHSAIPVVKAIIPEMPMPKSND